MFSFSSERSLFVFLSWEFISSICLFLSLSSLFAERILAEKISIRTAITTIAPTRVRKKAIVDIERSGADPAEDESVPANNNDPGTIIKAAAVVNRANRRGK